MEKELRQLPLFISDSSVHDIVSQSMADVTFTTTPVVGGGGGPRREDVDDSDKFFANESSLARREHLISIASIVEAAWRSLKEGGR